MSDEIQMDNLQHTDPDGQRLADRNFIRINESTIADLERRLAVAVEALKKIDKRWFDPNDPTRGVCGACDGGMHAFPDPRPEYHDDDCPYETAHVTLAQLGEKEKGES